MKRRYENVLSLTFGLYMLQFKQIVKAYITAYHINGKKLKRLGVASSYGIIGIISNLYLFII